MVQEVEQSVYQRVGGSIHDSPGLHVNVSFGKQMKHGASLVCECV